MTEVYYFSGTGNCLAVANAVARLTDARLIPMASLAECEAVRPCADTVGLVFPVYYSRLPLTVKAFASRLAGIEGKYVFAVCTFGGAAGRSLWQLRRLIASRGGRLGAAFGVPMPQNAFAKLKENRERIYARCDKAVQRIAAVVAARKDGTFYSNRLIELMMLCLHPLILHLCRRKFAALSGKPESTDFDALLRHSDYSFRVNDACTRCGICEKVCPESNIRITEAGPVWLHRCVHCLACYNWCPHRAVESGIAQMGYYYRHPDIKAAEIMAQQPR